DARAGRGDVLRAWRRLSSRRTRSRPRGACRDSRGEGRGDRGLSREIVGQRWSRLLLRLPARAGWGVLQTLRGGRCSDRLWL
ncbi:MAG: hypothetical protein AVDCRST_MAG58-3943, partial [uncultured Rubrobacteraceae bacterium]